ncbi:MAG: glycosyltransferase [Rhizobiaceae bacterium]|nr:glycosyltransferase [Rhizobiaceae bacterium]
MTDLRIFIGWDSREEVAYDVARYSVLKNASIELDVVAIKLDDLVTNQVYTRDIDPLASTEFTYSRFLTPYLANYSGWALFFDCDFLFFGDVAELKSFMDPSKAVCCVQHDYKPKETTKMDGQAQSIYPRKNWSSFMLFNCDHPSTKKLTPELVNTESGAYLHRMNWAKDDEIGDIPIAWNWLEGWNSVDEDGEPKAVHFTSGGPWFENYQDVDFAEAWRQAAMEIRK